ncbi:MAG: M3 family metallopeptidase [Gammaproteobacteria bacterium]|nr:M3 family metallopeptidase [Gammaproteobacteria bacterium]
MQPAEIGPAWDLSTEYADPDDPAIDADLETLARLLDEIEVRNGILAGIIPELPDAAVVRAAERRAALEAAREVFALREEAARLLEDPETYALCRLSEDSADAAALALQGRLQTLRVRFGEAGEPLSQFVDLAPQAWIDEYLDDRRVGASAFAVRHSRRRRHGILGLDEERLVAALGQVGFHAWARLYYQLAGSLSVEVRDPGGGKRRVGAAETGALMQSADDAVREDAWRGLNRAWGAHEHACAAVLNAIAGWRVEMCRRRSKSRPVHYLDEALHANAMERATLDALVCAAREHNELGRRAAKAMAKAYGKTRIGPWDQRAPAPAAGVSRASLPFAEAVEIVADAYRGIAPEMGEFVGTMVRRRWVAGAVGPRRRPGAYCTWFEKTRTPRVHMTYSGSVADVPIIAHEFGHAHHFWLMRDLPDAQRGIGAAVAETASTFGETVVRDALLDRATSPEEQLAVAWEDASAAVAFLLNIPTRFEFETRFYDARAERPLRPDELAGIMSDAWRTWHGDALSEPDPLFWASKQHFAFSAQPFYNFPYLFGFLFSLGVYGRRGQKGQSFYDGYRALLRDTGRMTVEELARTHLDADLSEPHFWRHALAALARRIERFELLVAASVRGERK